MNARDAALAEALGPPDPKLFVIWERHRRMWWAAACQGYTANLLEAGVYTEAQLGGRGGANLDEGVDVPTPLLDALGAIWERSADGRRVVDVCLDAGVPGKAGGA